MTLFDPDQLPFLYHSPIEGPHSTFPYSRVDLAAPDLERFPQFANSRSVSIELHPGEMLFLPAFWWHDVVSIGENVAVNFWWQLLTDREMANLGRAFAAFQDAVKAVPPEWSAHMRRLTREFL